MPIAFSLKSNQQTTYYGSYSVRPLEIRGHFSMQGPQREDMIPSYVAEIFKNNPEIKSVAINRADSGAVWQRIEPKDPT